MADKIILACLDGSQGAEAALPYAAAIGAYTMALSAQWSAVTDLLNTVQVEDLVDLQRLINEFGRALSQPENIPAPNLPVPPQ